MSALLKHARVNAGKTIEDVASFLKIKKQYLIALEEGQLDLIPAKVYVRGYLKLYSDYLGIPLNPREEEIDQLQEIDSQTILKNQNNQIIVKYKWKKQLIIISIIALIIIQLIFPSITSSE